MTELRVDRHEPEDPAVERAWCHLQHAGAVTSPFLSWEWFSSLRDVPELTGGIEVLVCRTADQVLGLLPLELAPGPELRTLGVAGWQWQVPDHLDVVAVDRQAVGAAVARSLVARRDWEVLDLDGLRADGGLLRGLHASIRWPRAIALRIEDVTAPFVRLDGAGSSEFITNHRRKVRRDLRRGSFSVVRDPDEGEKMLCELMDLHVARFGDRSCLFATPGRRQFHLLACRRLMAVGGARIHRLVVDGVTAALSYALAWDGRLLFYASGFQPSVGLTPGFSVRVAAVIAAAEDGFVEADLLRGAHEWKDRFVTEVRHDVRWRAVRVSTPVFRVAARRVVGRLAGTRRWTAA